LVSHKLYSDAASTIKPVEFKIEDSIVNTDKAVKKWDEKNGGKGEQNTLYQSADDRFYIVHTSKRSGSLPRAEFVSNEASTRWILKNGYELPALLKMKWSGFSL
jgi:hypothetical protein